MAAPDEGESADEPTLSTRGPELGVAVLMMVIAGL